MDDSTGASVAGRWASRVVWAALGLLAGVALVSYALKLTDVDDADNQETTLAEVVAGQLVDGPGTLYGPFERGNHRVLVQAPLYYRLSALVAWPLTAAGFAPVDAAIRAGRLVSITSFAGLLALVAAIARRDGGTRRASAWAVGLVVGSRVFMPYPATTRPDLLGVALQALGILSTIRALGGVDAGRHARWAALAFAAACCVKQSNLAAGVVSGLLLGIGAYAGTIRARVPLQYAAMGLGVVGGYYGLEQAFSGGRMARAVFVVPAAIGRLSPGGWDSVFWINAIVATYSGPLLLLGLAALLTCPRDTRGGGLNARLWAYLLAEWVLCSAMYYSNAGGWINYALMDCTLAAILVGRLADRALGPAAKLWAGAVVALALGLATANELLVIGQEFRRSVSQTLSLRELLTDPAFRGLDRSAIYFVGTPQYNRLLGNDRLIHDEWLYAQFEPSGDAEPRSRWLAPALVADGPIRMVVAPVDPPFLVPVDPPVVPGRDLPLTAFGYKEVTRHGRFRAWVR